MRWTAALGLCIATLAFSGCSICRCKENCCGDVIDDISDHECELECLYHPGLDVSRIGKPDWCECPINSLLDYDRCACNRPYYGPRNRWRDLNAHLQSGYAEVEQILPVERQLEPTGRPHSETFPATGG